MFSQPSSSDREMAASFDSGAIGRLWQTVGLHSGLARRAIPGVHRGALENAIIGELMAAHAEQRGLAGLVIFGAIRDSAELARGTFPVFASGVTHRGPYKDGPGAINVPIAVAGLLVAPGDLVCGDTDGLLAISPSEIEKIHDRAAQKLAAEQLMMAAIRTGGDDRSWIDRALEAAGCEYRDV